MKLIINKGRVILMDTYDHLRAKRDPFYEAFNDEKEHEKKVLRWLLAVVAAALVVGFLAGQAFAQDFPEFPTFKVGTIEDGKYASVCADKATAKKIVLLQASEGIAAARSMFASSGVCFADWLQFVPVRLVESIPIPNSVPVNIIEIRSARDPTAPHLFVITEGCLVDEPDT